MSSLFSRLSAMILMLAFAGVTACSAGDRANSTLPTPAVDAPMAVDQRPSRLRLSQVAASGEFRPCSST